MPFFFRYQSLFVHIYMFGVKLKHQPIYVVKSGFPHKMRPINLFLIQLTLLFNFPNLSMDNRSPFLVCQLAFLVNHDNALKVSIRWNFVSLNWADKIYYYKRSTDNGFSYKKKCWHQIKIKKLVAIANGKTMPFGLCGHKIMGV